MKKVLALAGWLVLFGSVQAASMRPTSPPSFGAGLFYAYNTLRGAAKGRIVFEPTAKLLARFGGGRRTGSNPSVGVRVVRYAF